jgi:hypothetical protein
MTMKRQIAVFVAIIVASSFTAFGQAWITIGDLNHGTVWDDFSGKSPEWAGNGDANIEVMWAIMGTADPFAGTLTNGMGAAEVTDVPVLLSSGWSLLQNYNSGSGSAALGTVETTTGNDGSISPYNGGNPFEIASTSIPGGDIELIFIGFNSSATSYAAATAFGISDMMVDTVGTSSTDPNAQVEQNAGPVPVSPFGVEGPEPTTLALAGLGGLSMLCLRRRKA